MWTLAESLLPSNARNDDVSAYTQGLMDLGATLCVRGKPDCLRCPFAADCVANVTGRQRELPTARPKKAVPTRRTWMLVLRDGDAVMLEKRPPSGIWGGLWSLPEAADEATLAERARDFGGDGAVSPLAPLTHTFTHFRLDIEPRLAELDRGWAHGLRWVTRKPHGSRCAISTRTACRRRCANCWMACKGRCCSRARGDMQSAAVAHRTSQATDAAACSDERRRCARRHPAIPSVFALHAGRSAALPRTGSTPMSGLPV